MPTHIEFGSINALWSELPWVNMSINLKARKIRSVFVFNASNVGFSKKAHANLNINLLEEDKAV